MGQHLAPIKTSRVDKRRISRGYGGKGGGTGGRGTRGQKSRSGRGIRPGFEGGQTPLYRRQPKLRGIAGGMKSGVPSFVVINIEDIEQAFSTGEEVNLDVLKRKRLINSSGGERNLTLKVLGGGSLTKPVKVNATAFSTTAKEKIIASVRFNR